MLRVTVIKISFPRYVELMVKPTIPRVMLDVLL